MDVSSIIKKHWPLITTISMLSVCIIILLILIFSQNNGHYVYTYDDTYIHMAMAKHLSQDGVWGITKYGFTSCSSSLFWTSFIAFIYLITGPNEITPFVISLVCALMILSTIHIIYKNEGIKPLFTFFVIMALMYFICLPYHIISGLEHTMHAFVNIIFIYLAAEYFSEKRTRVKDVSILFLLAVLMPLLRFEGIVSVLFMCFLVILKKKFLLSFFLLLGGVIPITVFGLISVSNGWAFFPNSVLMKLNFPDLVTLNDFQNLMNSVITKLMKPVPILVFSFIILASISVYFFYRKNKEKVPRIGVRDFVLVSFYLVNALFYVAFSHSNMASRYQHFLVAMAFFVSGILFFRNSFYENRSIKAAFLSMGVVVFLSSVFFWDLDSYDKIITTPERSGNIYQQQYQMAHFFKRYYSNKVIGLNDIGTTGYFTDAKIVDLWGLGDFEVSKLRRENYSKNDLRNLSRTRKLDIAFVYDEWLGITGCNVIPDEWIKVGEWKISNNIICGSDIVSLYAIGVGEKDSLIKNLKDYSKDLPQEVKQSGDYTLNSH